MMIDSLLRDLHYDPTASHYLKIILDSIFGPKNYKNDISWRRSPAHSDTKQGRQKYGNVRDTLFFYAKSCEWTWNPQYTKYTENYKASMYRFAEPGTDRRYRKDNLTAAKAGGDTRYGWRVMRTRGGEWEADLKAEYKNPQASREYRDILPYGKRIWAYSKDSMVKYANEGRIAYSESGHAELQTLFGRNARRRAAKRLERHQTRVEK